MTSGAQHHQVDLITMLTTYEPTADAPWNLPRVVHLHRRAGFAAPWIVLQRDLADGPQLAIERLISPPKDDVTAAFEKMSQVIVEAAVNSGDINRLKAWWIYRLLYSPDVLGERLTLMWHNHFATSHAKVQDVELMHRQNATLRAAARGPFGELLGRMLQDPALLVWLDADANRKEHPNENLAREVMELFTLGVGNYSEQDVKEAARALTGWSVRKQRFHEDARHHDTGQKEILGQRGTWNGQDLVNLLVQHPATSRRIAFRLCEMLLGEGQAGPEPIEQLASGLRERDLDIGWALQTILRSQLFFSTENMGNRVRDPVEFVVGAVRSLELTDPPPSTLLLAETLANLGQDLFVPPNVFGWPGGRSWLTSRTVIARTNFAAALIGGQLSRPVEPVAVERLAELHGFKGEREMTRFYSEVIFGHSHFPGFVQSQRVDPRHRVVAMLASPEAQLA